jgi:hypothetical protein
MYGKHTNPHYNTSLAKHFKELIVFFFLRENIDILCVLFEQHRRRIGLLINDLQHVHQAPRAHRSVHRPHFRQSARGCYPKWRSPCTQ